MTILYSLPVGFYNKLSVESIREGLQDMRWFRTGIRQGLPVIVRRLTKQEALCPISNDYYQSVFFFLNTTARPIADMEIADTAIHIGNPPVSPAEAACVCDAPGALTLATLTVPPL